MRNSFGRRFIRLRELSDYALELNLCTHQLDHRFIEFLERHGMLNPVRRVQMPAEVIRRFQKEKYLGEDYSNVAVEQDGPRLEAASELMNELNFPRWHNAPSLANSEHPLDVVKSRHATFIQTEFSPESFRPWDDHRVRLYDTSEGPVLSSFEHDSPSFYHYWQIFWLAALLRSGLHVYYPLDDEELTTRMFEGQLSTEQLSGKAYLWLNIEARTQLRQLEQYRHHFEAVGYFRAYSHRALQAECRHLDRRGLVPTKRWRSFLKREEEIAKVAMTKGAFAQTDILSFIGKQCEWWDQAGRIGPPALADEYKRNIAATVSLLRAATGVETEHIVSVIGHQNFHPKPTLKVIFPDWAEEQRSLVLRELREWADAELASLPPPFPYTRSELDQFCDWLEQRGLFQFYWHFRRLVDLERRNDPVHHAARTSEIVGFATLCEMVTNEVMVDRGLVPRGSTLRFKLGKIFDGQGPVNLEADLKRFKKLTGTNQQTLPQRLSQIARITNAAGSYSPVVRILLSLIAIRNEGAHLGLLRFEPHKVIDMTRVLSIAALVIWKAR